MMHYQSQVGKVASSLTCFFPPPLFFPLLSLSSFFYFMIIYVLQLVHFNGSHALQKQFLASER